MCCRIFTVQWAARHSGCLGAALGCSSFLLSSHRRHHGCSAPTTTLLKERCFSLLQQSLTANRISAPRRNLWPVRHIFLFYPKILMTEEGRKFAIIPVTSSSAVILKSRCFKCSTGWCVMYSVKRKTAFKVCILLFICH